MKTHFGYETHDEEDYIEKHQCGTIASEYYSVSTDPKEITCKKCVKQYEKYKQSHEEEQIHICNQMGEMASFMRSIQN